MRTVRVICYTFAVFALLIASSGFAADEGVWVARKFSGEVWTTAGDLQQASLKTDDVLMPGNTISTGRNGRVLLVRGEESILIAPNSVVGLPAEKKDGLATTIMQRAGSILLEVEKKKDKHFSVETPFAAAVVKGTQFRLTVSASGAKVEVVRGQVEVADFKTGQIAQVMPGQHASVPASGSAGLVLGGPGTLQPIQQGQPRPSSIDRVPVPRAGLKPGLASLQQRHASEAAKQGTIRISTVLGEVRLNVHRATHGLARSSTPSDVRNVQNRESPTIWAATDTGSSGSSAASGSVASGNGNANSGGNGNSGGYGNFSGYSNSSGNGNAGGVSGVVGGVVGGVGGAVGGVGGVAGAVGGGVGRVVGGVGGLLGRR